MVELCYWYHARKACRYGSRCHFVHQTIFDPTVTYYTCTHRRRVRIDHALVFSLLAPPIRRRAPLDPKPVNPGHVVIIELKETFGSSRGGTWIEYQCERRWNNNGMPDLSFAIQSIASIHRAIISVERGLELHPDPYTPRDQVLALPLPEDLLVVIYRFLSH